MSQRSPPTDTASLPSLDFHRGMLDDFPTLVRISSLHGSSTYVNSAWLAFTGRNPASELGAGWLGAIHPDDRAAFCEKQRGAIASRSPYETEYRLRRRDGAYRWLIDRGSPSRNAAGEVTGYIAFCYDTTDRRDSDSARREIEEQVRLLGLATRDMVWSWDARTDRAINNAAFSEALGDLPGPMAASVAWWKQRVHPDDARRVLAAFQKAIDGKLSDAICEYRFRRRDGSYASLDDRICLVRDVSGKVVRVIGAMRDITERKSAEDTQTRFVQILETTRDFVAMADAAGNVLYLNRAGRRLLGLPLEGPLGARQLRDIHPAWANEIIFEEGIPSAVSDGTWAGETAVLDANGGEVPISQVIVSHPGADGTGGFISTIMRDIRDRKREETARIEWANRYDAAIRASGQLLFDWNSVTNEITYGGDVERLLGFTLHEMRGGLDRLRKLIHPEDLPSFDEEIARVLESRDPFHLGLRLRRKDGRQIDVDAKGYFFLDRQGSIGRMVGFLADVTEQKHAQEELARAHDSLEARVNERTAELEQTYAVIRDRALQQETVAHLGQRALAGANVQSLFDEAAELVRTTLKVDCCSILERNADGTSMIVRGNSGWPESNRHRVVPGGDESQSGYTLIVREPVIVEDMAKETRFRISSPVSEIGAKSGISVMIQAGDEPIGVLCALTLQRRTFTQDDVHYLQSIANVLTAAVDSRHAEESIRLAQEQAESANRAKSEFLSRMSHELRTPLNAILGFTQLLEVDEPTPSQAESISHISRAGNHLLSLINEVLDIARIEAGRLALSPEPIELPGFLGDAVELIRPLAVRHEVELRLNVPAHFEPRAFADRQRLQQVILNLLSNAVKYNRRGGRVTVDCATIREGRLRISVADTGIGIDAEKMSRLFTPFERLGADALNIEGTGIGLTLSQRIAGAMQGELGVESEAGVGSTFWIELPVAVTFEKEEPLTFCEPDEIASSDGHEKAHTLLYIEDQDLNLRLVERILLTRPEYKLLSAMQGGLALDLAREHRPDLILLDLNLPDMPGDEVLRRLKDDTELCEIPVIMVSADAMGERIQKLIAAGATDYVTKPYRVSDFLRVIEKALLRG